jgi:outer membrane receptor protein involved in Fe transport
VDYGYDYLSYSAGVNYRFADSLSAFARYSRGGRASAERILSAGPFNPTTGAPNNPATILNIVKQAEAGVKFRKDALSLFVTGFWASTDDRNFQIGADANGQFVVSPVIRTYRAKGVELEGEWRRGPFTIAVGATYTEANIKNDEIDPSFNGNRPRHIPDLFFFVRPSFDLDKVSFGAAITGTTESFAQDSNMLVQPGYVLVSPFVQYRPTDGLTVALNAFNLFDTLAVVDIGASAVPPSGIANAQVMNGRTVTASLRYSF